MGRFKRGLFIFLVLVLYSIFIVDIDISLTSAAPPVDGDGSPSVVCYLDNDGDTYGAGQETVFDGRTCPDGYRRNSVDCNDTNSLIHPGATETCDNIDSDCDGSLDDVAVGSTCYVGGDIHSPGICISATVCDDDEIAINEQYPIFELFSDCYTSTEGIRAYDSTPYLCDSDLDPTSGLNSDGVCAFFGLSGDIESESTVNCATDEVSFQNKAGILLGGCYYSEPEAECDSNVSDGRYIPNGICAVFSSAASFELDPDPVIGYKGYRRKLQCETSSACYWDKYIRSVSYCPNVTSCDSNVSDSQYSQDGIVCSGSCVGSASSDCCSDSDCSDSEACNTSTYTCYRINPCASKSDGTDCITDTDAEGVCVSQACQATSAYWTDASGNPINSDTGVVDPSNNHTMYLRVSNTNSSVNSITISIGGSSQNPTVLGTLSGTTYDVIWEMTDDILADTSSDSFVMNFTTNNGLISNDLTFTRTYSQCYNGVMDGDENCTDAGGSCESIKSASTCCGDGIENAVDCTATCAADPSDCTNLPAASWFPEATQYNLTLDELASGSFSILMQIINNQSQSPTFTLREQDTLLDDTVFSSVQATSSTSNSLSYNWTPTLQNFKDASPTDSGEPDSTYDFYFQIDSQESPLFSITTVDSNNNPVPLPYCGDGVCQTDFGEDESSCLSDCQCININTCQDYASEATCVYDACSVGENVGEGISCSWSASSCVTGQSYTINGVEIGTCEYPNQSQDDTCDDGYLTYSYDAQWTWGQANSYTTQISSDYILGDDGLYHYDPERASESCVGGERTIPCPAKVQLTFFTTKNIIATVILIIMGYLILEQTRQSKEKKSRKKTSKKKISKNKKTVKKKSKK